MVCGRCQGENPGSVGLRVAALLRGKHKPEYTPHVDTGDFVIVINAKDVQLSGEKYVQKDLDYRHSGWPGGLKMTTAAEMRDKRPERMIELAVKGMLPRTSLGRRQLRKLKVMLARNTPIRRSSLRCGNCAD